MNSVMPSTGMPLVRATTECESLVREQRGEEHTSRPRPSQCRSPCPGRGSSGEDAEGEAPEDQGEDDEPREVDADLEAEHRTEPEVPHLASPFAGCTRPAARLTALAPARVLRHARPPPARGRATATVRASRVPGAPYAAGRGRAARHGCGRGSFAGHRPFRLSARPLTPPAAPAASASARARRSPARPSPGAPSRRPARRPPRARPAAAAPRPTGPFRSIRR